MIELSRHGDLFSLTVFRQCEQGHTFTTPAYPLCPVELEPDDDTEGRYGTGICTRCQEPFHRNSTIQKRCLACQVTYGVELEKQRNGVRKKVKR